MAGERQKPRFSYGLEWGALLTVYHWDAATYNAEEGFLVTDDDSDYDFHANGTIAWRIGVDFSHLAVSLLAGWQGYGRGHRGYPFMLRGEYHFRGTQGDGTFVRLESGFAIPEKRNEKTAWSMGMGFGRHVTLTQGLALDLAVSVQPCLIHPAEVYDDYDKTYITHDRIRNAREIWLPMKLTVGLDF